MIRCVIRSDDLRHLPVLHTSFGKGGRTVFDLLQPKPGERVLDVTLGLAGHSAEFLRVIGQSGSLVALEADTENLQRARKGLSFAGTQADLRHGNFRNVRSLVQGTFDIVFADLGLSSPHVDDPERGFTFRADARLDMRFDRMQGRSAAELLCDLDDEGIARILREYGEVPRAMNLARVIKRVIRDRQEEPLTTAELKTGVEEVFGYRTPHLLPQIFQALRIAVNDEIGALQALLSALPLLLNPGGRAGIISYHSLEDRLVKQTFRGLTTPDKHESTGQDLAPAPFILLTKKPLIPSDEEIIQNPRSRSAKFRAIQKRL